jgi:hypothetical protein
VHAQLLAHKIVLPFQLTRFTISVSCSLHSLALLHHSKNGLLNIADSRSMNWLEHDYYNVVEYVDMPAFYKSREALQATTAEALCRRQRHLNRGADLRQWWTRKRLYIYMIIRFLFSININLKKSHFKKKSQIFREHAYSYSRQ